MLDVDRRLPRLRPRRVAVIGAGEAGDERVGEILVEQKPGAGAAGRARRIRAWNGREGLPCRQSRGERR
jgi:hypothetical protein